VLFRINSLKCYQNILVTYIFRRSILALTSNPSGLYIQVCQYLAPISIAFASMGHRKECSPNSAQTLSLKGGVWEWNLLFRLYLAHSLMFQIDLIYNIIRFVKANMILNVKEVPNDKFEFDAERVREVLMSQFCLKSVTSTFTLG